MANYTITTGNDDFYTTRPDGGSISTDYTNTTLIFERNNIIYPSITRIAFGDINTDAIPDTDVISAATLYFYFDSYTAGRGSTKTYNVWILKADESSYILIHSGTFVSAGWYSVVLTASEIAEIDKVGKTMFRFTVDDPGALKARRVYIRAYEYDAGHTYPMYLDVTHAAPSTGVITRTLLGVGQ